MEAISSFGHWLLRRRKALDLTQDALARQAGCALGTLKKIETDERRPSRQLAERLADCLAIPVAERAAFVQAARAELATDQLEIAAPLLEATAAATNLPSGTVTFLFTDIEGSTRLWEQHPQAMAAALARHDAIVRTTTVAHEGVVFRTIGDAFCIAFSTATAACAAALAAQRALAGEAWGVVGAVPVRMALHTCAAVPTDGDYRTGALNRLGRLLGAVHGGQIVLSQTTADLARETLPPEVTLRDLGERHLRDLRPEPVFQLIAPDLPSAFPPLKTLDRPRHNLPVQPTELIGREQAIATICAMLRRADVRHITLTGSGGIGKTRLGFQVAAELLDDFANGVYFVNLAPLRDPTLVASTIAQTLGLREAVGQPLLERLRAYLHDKALLLLLDNFEQVADAAPLLAELLAGCPLLKIVVTSRARLNLRGEKEFPVSPLALPDLGRLPPLDHLTQYAAVALFIQRARDVQPAFAVTNENAPAVAEICARLDGLPLAIELAAARVKLFAPQALLARFGSQLKLLTGGSHDLPARQQTIRNTIDWSYTLLSPTEQCLFRRLAVFVGGWTLEAAATVCDVDGDLGLDVVDGLQSLVDKSLVRLEEGSDGAPRFRRLETIREYALERLEESQETEALRRRHAAYYLAATIEVGNAQLVMQTDVTGHGLAAEVDNLRAVLRWAIVHREAEIAQRISVALNYFGEGLGRVHVSEVRAWLERALALGDADDASPAAGAVRASALDAAGWVAGGQGDYDRAAAYFAAGLALVQQLGDRAGTALAQRALGWVALRRGELVAAQTWAEQSLALCRAADDPAGLAWSLYDLGHLAFVRGEPAQAEPLLTESLALFRGQANEFGCMRALISLGYTARAQGQLARATACYQESFRVRPSMDAEQAANALEGLAAAAGAHGQTERAARLFGAAETLRESMDIPLPPVQRAGYERDVAAARAQLDAASFAAAWAAGRQMTLDQAIAEALEPLRR